MNYRGIQLAYNTEAYATHQPVLIWALENTSGNVLELGCGDYSTPLVQRLSFETGRNVVSVESSQEWLDRYKSNAPENHQLIYSNNWMQIIDVLSYHNWDVVFIDIEPELYRYYALCRFLPKAKYIVAHDSDLLNHFRSKLFNWVDFIPTIQPLPNRKGPSTIIVSAYESLKDMTNETFIL